MLSSCFPDCSESCNTHQRGRGAMGPHYRDKMLTTHTHTHTHAHMHAYTQHGSCFSGQYVCSTVLYTDQPKRTSTSVEQDQPQMPWGSPLPLHLLPLRVEEKYSCQ